MTVSIIDRGITGPPSSGSSLEKPFSAAQATDHPRQPPGFTPGSRFAPHRANEETFAYLSGLTVPAGAANCAGSPGSQFCGRTRRRRSDHHFRLPPTARLENALQRATLRNPLGTSADDHRRPPTSISVLKTGSGGQRHSWVRIPPPPLACFSCGRHGASGLEATHVAAMPTCASRITAGRMRTRCRSPIHSRGCRSRRWDCRRWCRRSATACAIAACKPSAFRSS